MKTKQLFLITMLITAGLSYKSIAQVPGLPNPSATQTISQEIGLGNVSVTYSRPNVKDRKIYGGLVPYGIVWRTGANTATEITFSENVKIDGQAVPAGSYSLFTIPGKDEWIIIINKKVKDWGAYTYDEKNDLLRLKVKSTHLAEKQESFTIQFINSTTNSADLRIVWDHTAVATKVTVDDDDARITANIDHLMETEHPGNLVYFNAIQYYWAHDNKDIDKALGWVDRAKKDVPTNPAFYLFESKLKLKKGDKVGAIAAAEGGIKLAKERKFDEYIKLNSQQLELAKR
jgi:hypothetical protein